MRPIQRNEFFYLAAILLPSYMTLQSFYGSNDIVDHLIKFLGVLTFLGMGYCAPDQDGEFVIIAYTLLWMWSALNTHLYSSTGFRPLFACRELRYGWCTNELFVSSAIKMFVKIVQNLFPIMLLIFRHVRGCHN